MADNSYKDQLTELKKRRARSFIKNTIFLVFFVIISAVFFTWLGTRSVFFFMFLGLLPAISSAFFDKKPGRYASKVVFAFNITGITPYVVAIASSGNADVVAQRMMLEPASWILVYGFAAFGWTVIYIVPQITLLFLEIRSKFLITKMEKFQEDLIAEWGEEVQK